MDSTKLDAALHKFADLRGRVDAVAERLERRSDASVEVSTRDYVSTHGKEPRGNGSFAFVFEGGKTEFAPSSSYGEAKAWAIKRAKELFPNQSGSIRVSVGT
jgi:hypothetical protein